MPYYDGAKTVTNLFLLGFTLGAVTLLIHSDPVRGMGDNVQVMVCPQADQSSLAVLQPQSDSVVNEPKLSVSGTVENISQIDFFIDDTYNNTVALGFSATEFASTITLAPGTHTIKLVASDSCSQTIHEFSLVVTYEPKTPPSVGENIETEVDGEVRPGVAPPVVPESEKNIIERVIDRFIVPPYESVKDMLDIGEPAGGAPGVRAGNIARSALFVTGALLTLSAVHIGALSASVLPDKLASLLPFRRRAMTAIALIGLALMALVFMV